MKNKPTNVSVSPEVMKALHEIGKRHSLTGNQILAAAATELARIKPGDLWHALGRIAADDGGATLPAPEAPRIERSSRQRALQHVG